MGPMNLIADMNPLLEDKDYVFATVPDGVSLDALDAFAMIRESEGFTAIIEWKADSSDASFNAVRWRKIKLQIFSDLEAVGLTAAFSTALAQAEIPCNVIAAIHHDYVFVPKSKAEEALIVLQMLQRETNVGR